MASKDEQPKQKKQGMVKQIIQIFQFTHKGDPAVPWLCAGALLAPIVLCIILGIVFHWNWFGWISWMIVAVLFGILFAVMTLTNRADQVGYRQLEGRTGAAISILGNLKKAGFTFPQEPVWVDPRTQDAIWRGTGYNGIYLIGEGDYGHVMRAMDRQEKMIKGVTAGSDIPIYRIAIGSGPKQVQLKDLRRVIMKKKTYFPNTSGSAVGKKLHPRKRFMLTKDQLSALNDRLRTLQRKNGMPIPKGMDPMKQHKVSRRAMRGK